MTQKVFRTTPDAYFEQVIAAVEERRELALPFESKAKAQRIRYLFYVARMQAARSGDPVWGRRITVRVEQRAGEWFTVFYREGYDAALAKALEAVGIPPAPRPDTTLDSPLAPASAPVEAMIFEPDTPAESRPSLIDAIRAVTAKPVDKPGKESK